MGRLLKWLVGLLALSVIGLCVWWVVMAEAQEQGARKWLADQARRGWQAEAAEIEVTGFPTDFDFRATELRLADPQTGWSWQAPWLAAASAALRPNRMLVRLPPEHRVAVPGETAAIRSQTMTADLHVEARSSMALIETGVDIDALEIAGQSGWIASAERLGARVGQRPDALSPPNSYDVAIEGTRIVLPQALVAAIDPTGFLDPKIGEIELTGYMALAEPLDRTTVEDGRLALTAAVIRRAGFSWGTMRLDARGQFEVDAQGYPVGEIQIEAREWRRMVELAERSGMIGPELADTITAGLEIVTAFTGGRDLRVPLSLSRGKVRIGPVTIADAPRLSRPRPGG